jgi:hypothetical protein
MDVTDGSMGHGIPFRLCTKSACSLPAQDSIPLAAQGMCENAFLDLLSSADWAMRDL